MNFIVCSTLLINILYAAILLSYFFSVRKTIKQSHKSVEVSRNWPSVSIIIPFRDEAKNLPSLINDLTAIDYPAERLEIIFVNDNSTDESLTLLDNRNRDFKVISFTSGFGKKAALESGINNSRNEWIVTIDADIHFSSGWLKNLIMPALNANPVMICGLVQIDIDKENKWSVFQSMEFAMLQLSGSAALMQGKSLLNSGANLAFKKQAWEDVGGYQGNKNIASGDDTFLLFAMNKLFPGKIIPAIDSMVHTSAQSNFKKLLQQRLRWAGKTIYYREPYVWVIGILVFFSSVSFIACICGLMYLPIFFLKVVGIIFFIRLFAERLLLSEFSKKYNVKFGFGNILLMSLFYPFFIVILILIRPFNKITWKGREL